MKLERHLSPGKLALMSLCGAMLLYLATLALEIANYAGRLHRSPLSIPFLLLGLLPYIVGAVWLQIGKAGLERGIIADRWSEDALRALRAELNQRWLRYSAVGSAAFGGICILLDLLQRFSHHVHGVSLGAFSILLVTPRITLQSLQRLLAPPRPRVDPWWNRTWKPLASKHWGQGQASQNRS